MKNALSAKPLGSLALPVRNAAVLRVPVTSRVRTVRSFQVNALFGNPGNKQPQQQQGMYPPVYGSQQAIASDQLSPAQRDKLQLGTALRNIGWLSFWSQLILTSVSTVILLFSTGVTSSGALAIAPMDACTLVGAACGLITTFLSWTWIRAGRRLSLLQDVRLDHCMGTVLASTNLNLIGMGATILGLQATVGTLVSKTLTTAAGVYYGPRAAPPPVALDVFSIQACANTLMAHFAGMVLANWLLRVVRKYMTREEDREVMPSAPPAY